MPAFYPASLEVPADCQLIVECSSGAKRERSDTACRFQLERSDNQRRERSDAGAGAMARGYQASERKGMRGR
jgi:hypothetical protein